MAIGAFQQARCRRRLPLGGVALCVLVAGVAASPAPAAERPAHASASSVHQDAAAHGALDGNRFGVDSAQVWKGSPAASGWWWQCSWDEPRDVGAILQIVGDDELRLRNAPRTSRWQASLDGRDWRDLPETAVESERRAFRLHRLKAPVRLRYLRLRIDRAWGEYPTIREVETYADPDADLAFPDWLAIESTLDRHEWDAGHTAGQEFVTLARKCQGWEHVPAQHVWLGDFDESFVAAEPAPLCAMLSGNFSDWCQKDRAAWRGTQEVLTAGRLPMWAACGGAQGLAILADVGTERAWDCPHCRDPKNPKLPIYGHIGHSAGAAPRCGDYSACSFERGPTRVLQIADDPVFRGLAREFQVVESHCGQIEYAPRGWVQIATHGTGGKTAMQCLRVANRYIYAAQFHIELAGTPESSRQIMTNFLELAKAWGGYCRGDGAAPAPRPFR